MKSLETITCWTERRRNTVSELESQDADHGVNGGCAIEQKLTKLDHHDHQRKERRKKKQDDDLVKLSTHKITAPGFNLAASSLISFLGIRARSVVRNSHLPPCRRPDKRRGYDQGGTNAIDSNNNNVNETELNLLISIHNHVLP